MLTDLLRSFRILVIAGVSICLAPRVAPAAPASDLSKQELAGPVKTAVTRYPQLRTVHHFDREGRLRTVELFPTQESDSAQYHLSYDEAGRVTEEQTVEPDGHVLYKKIYRYGFDEQGRQVAAIAVTEDGQLAHAEFDLYDERGLLTEDLAITGNGTVEKSLYDVRGKLV